MAEVVVADRGESAMAGRVARVTCNEAALAIECFIAFHIPIL
jgi:hypothetical protein